MKLFVRLVAGALARVLVSLARSRSRSPPIADLGRLIDRTHRSTPPAPLARVSRRPNAARVRRASPPPPRASLPDVGITAPHAPVRPRIARADSNAISIVHSSRARSQHPRARVARRRISDLTRNLATAGRSTMRARASARRAIVARTATRRSNKFFSTSFRDAARVSDSRARACDAIVANWKSARNDFHSWRRRDFYTRRRRRIEESPGKGKDAGVVRLGVRVSINWSVRDARVMRTCGASVVRRRRSPSRSVAFFLCISREESHMVGKSKSTSSSSSSPAPVTPTWCDGGWRVDFSREASSKTLAVATDTCSCS